MWEQSGKDWVRDLELLNPIMRTKVSDVDPRFIRVSPELCSLPFQVLVLLLFGWRHTPLAFSRPKARCHDGTNRFFFL